MKKILLSMFLLCAFTAIKAQPKGFYYYSRLGLGVSEFNQLSNNNQTGKLALNIGVAGNYQFNNYVGLVVEANLSSKGSKITGTEAAVFPNSAQDYEDIYRLFYAEIPLIVKLSAPISESFYVKGFAGLSNNFKLIGTYSRNYDDPNEQDQLDQEVNGINLTEYSYLWGFGFEVKDNTDHLYAIDFRTNTAFSSFGNIRNSQNNVISGYNSYYTIGFGYSF